jgi:hypothetical protein
VVVAAAVVKIRLMMVIVAVVAPVAAGQSERKVLSFPLTK